MGNTGVEMTTVGLGWLQATIRSMSSPDVAALVGGAFGSMPEDRDGGNRWYRSSAEVGHWAFLAWSPRTRPGAKETYLEIRQSGFDVLGGKAGIELARQVVGLEAHVTRVDGYYDDRLRRAEPGTVADAFRKRLTLTHLTRVREVQTFVRRGPGALEAAGASTYLGSVKSLALIRVYDKAAESGVAGAGVRWEVQLRDERAGSFLQGAVAAGERLGNHVLGTIRGLVDFTQRKDGSRGDRAELLDWWASIIGDAERAMLRLPSKEDGLEQIAMWLYKQVAPSLALVELGYGVEFVRELLNSGARRLTVGQLRLLAGLAPDGASGEPAAILSDGAGVGAS